MSAGGLRYAQLCIDPAVACRCRTNVLDRHINYTGAAGICKDLLYRIRNFAICVYGILSFTGNCINVPENQIVNIRCICPVGYMHKPHSYADICFTAAAC